MDGASVAHDLNSKSSGKKIPIIIVSGLVLEDTGVSAYAGQGPHILQKAVIIAALEIHSVEARLAAWIRFLNGGGLPTADGSTATAPAPAVFDLPKTEKTVLAAVAATKFITG